jgi:hypothetical protein
MRIRLSVYSLRRMGQKWSLACKLKEIVEKKFSFGKGAKMKHEIYKQLSAEREINMAFNMGLQSAVFILEKAESLSIEGRRYLIESLKKNITENEVDDTLKLLECIPNNVE